MIEHPLTDAPGRHAPAHAAPLIDDDDFFPGILQGTRSQQAGNPGSDYQNHLT